MKFIAVPILTLLIIAQTFSQWLVVFSFNLNRDYIAKNICENRFRPKLKCKGNCVMMKRMKQQEENENGATGRTKIEPGQTLSSRTFFATLTPSVFISNILYERTTDTGKPIDRSFSFFRPPSI